MQPEISGEALKAGIEEVNVGPQCYGKLKIEKVRIITYKVPL